MDLESYIGRYTGETRLRRLLSIAFDRTGRGETEGDGNPELRKQALKLVEQQLLRDGNALLYRDIFGGGGDSRRIVDPEVFEGIRPYDADWANATEHSNRETRRVLEGRLSTAKSRLHKEAIRTAYLALAEHDVRTSRDNHKSLANLVGTRTSIGISTSISTSTSQLDTASDSTAHQYNKNAINARKALYSAMDCCTSRIQTAEIGLLIIESALNAGDYLVAKEYTERLESTLLRDNKDTNQDSVLSQIGIKIQIARGIERMISGEYQKAANALFSVVMMGSGEGGSSNSNETNSHSYSQGSNEYHKLHWPGVTAPEDVALYAGLMCLVTRDRSKMMTLADHPDALELVPSVKELLVHWCRANYAPCMRALSMDADTDRSESLSQPLLPMGMPVDAYLTPGRWNSLVQTLRETCLIEYLRPYERVKLDGLRDLLFPSPLDGGGGGGGGVETAMDALVDFLADLMDRELLPSTTRLDCREWVLFQTKNNTDPTPNLQAMEEKILDDTHAMLVRLACLEHDLGSNSAEGTSFGGKRGKKGQQGGRRYPRRGNSHHRGQHRSQSRGMADSSESEDDYNGGGGGGIFDFAFEKRAEGGGTGAAGGEMSDTHMIDADTTSQPNSNSNSAMNPEDMY